MSISSTPILLVMSLLIAGSVGMVYWNTLIAHDFIVIDDTIESDEL